MDLKELQAVIVNTVDPEKLNRVQIRVQGLHPSDLKDSELPWVLVEPIVGANSDMGAKAIMHKGQFCKVKALDKAMSEFMVTAGSNAFRETVQGAAEALGKEGRFDFSKIPNELLDSQPFAKIASKDLKKLAKTVWKSVNDILAGGVYGGAKEIGGKPKYWEVTFDVSRKLSCSPSGVSCGGGSGGTCGGKPSACTSSPCTAAESAVEQAKQAVEQAQIALDKVRENAIATNNSPYVIRHKETRTTPSCVEFSDKTKLTECAKKMSNLIEDLDCLTPTEIRALVDCVTPKDTPKEERCLTDEDIEMLPRCPKSMALLAELKNKCNNDKLTAEENLNRAKERLKMNIDYLNKLAREEVENAPVPIPRLCKPEKG